MMMMLMMLSIKETTSLCISRMNEITLPVSSDLNSTNPRNLDVFDPVSAQYEQSNATSMSLH